VRQADDGERKSALLLSRAAPRAYPDVAGPRTACPDLSCHVAAATTLVTSGATKPRPHKLARPLDHARTDFVCFRSFVFHRLTLRLTCGAARPLRPWRIARRCPQRTSSLPTSPSASQPALMP